MILAILCLAVYFGTQALAIWLGTILDEKGVLIWFILVADAIVAGFAMYGFLVLLPDSCEGFVKFISQSNI